MSGRWGTLAQDAEISSPPRMQMVWDVLKSAKDNNDQRVIAACRRLIEANRLGWTKYAKKEDYDLVKSFAE